MGEVTIAREQTSELYTYDTISVTLPHDRLMTLEELVSKARGELDLADDMTYLINGVPAEMTTVLSDGDHVFAKMPLKTRA